VGRTVGSQLHRHTCVSKSEKYLLIIFYYLRTGNLISHVEFSTRNSFFPEAKTILGVRFAVREDMYCTRDLLKAITLMCFLLINSPLFSQEKKIGERFDGTGSS
jgi:hypothetical protein